MASEKLNITSFDGKSFGAYISRPKASTSPGIIVIQEIFGINAYIRKIADDLAENGYFAIAPDLFWRQEPGVELSDQVEAEMGKAFSLYQNFNEDLGVKDLTSCLDYLRNNNACNGKVGTLGFCLGGKLAYLMATRSSTDCNIGYYGVGIEGSLGEAKNIKKPLLLHFGEDDNFVPSASQDEIKAVLGKIKDVKLKFYSGVSHAFARTGGSGYNQGTAESANTETYRFLDNALR